tara:strand:- start:17395 stop:18051 length:657 start_codon:yes stop_codon:yes gene_type:complete
MDLKDRIKIALGLEEEVKEVSLAFEAKLADGTIVVSEAEELAVGAVLNILSEDGEQTPLPEGTYELENGTKFTVDAEGLVTEVAEAEEEEEVVEEVEAPAEEELAAEEATEETTEAELFAEVGAVVKELLEEVRKDIARLSGELDELRGENLAKEENLADLQEENTKLSAQVEELNGQPAVEAVKLSKFTDNKKVELSKEDFANLTPQQKYLYNFNNK